MKNLNKKSNLQIFYENHHLNKSYIGKIFIISNDKSNFTLACHILLNPVTSYPGKGIFDYFQSINIKVQHRFPDGKF